MNKARGIHFFRCSEDQKLHTYMISMKAVTSNEKLTCNDLFIAFGAQRIEPYRFPLFCNKVPALSDSSWEQIWALGNHGKLTRRSNRYAKVEGVLVAKTGQEVRPYGDPKSRLVPDGWGWTLKKHMSSWWANKFRLGTRKVLGDQPLSDDSSDLNVAE